MKPSGNVTAESGILLSSPGISPAYIGVGYIIGPELGALNFAGGLLAWGLFVPLLVFFLGPSHMDTFGGNWSALVSAFDINIVRPIAVGGMLVGACYTLYRMRKNLIAALSRAVGDLKKSAGAHEATSRLDKDLNFKVVVLGSRIMRRFGVQAALYVLPVVALGAYGIVAFLPLLPLIRGAKISENSLDYSLNNTARQALFLPTSREAKYKAKAAIDTLFVRAGDLSSACLVFVGTHLAFQTREFAIRNMVVIAVWLVVVTAHSRRYGKLVETPGEETSAA